MLYIYLSAFSVLLNVCVFLPPRNITELYLSKQKGQVWPNGHTFFIHFIPCSCLLLSIFLHFRCLKGQLIGATVDVTSYTCCLCVVQLKLNISFKGETCFRKTDQNWTWKIFSPRISDHSFHCHSNRSSHCSSDPGRPEQGRSSATQKHTQFTHRSLMNRSFIKAVTKLLISLKLTVYLMINVPLCSFHIHIIITTITKKKRTIYSQHRLTCSA